MRRIDKPKVCERVVKRKCQACGNDKMFEPKGEKNPTYKYKCTKCKTKVM